MNGVRVTPGGTVVGPDASAFNSPEAFDWSDERGGGAGREDTYGNRVTEAGSVLDGDGFPISEAAGAQVTPDVVWTGRRFQVVWADGRSGAADIYGARGGFGGGGRPR
ncbi:hypothetical protein D7V80_02335 [Corallococcus sp. CA054B]|uniref:hypothetical protein n=1 Tax=Corallococcus sp. CA054B TaxID=2316734 RepID=UPI000EA387FD|nr:hypothetical protein [Corallococcus sp. CA054B]RKG71210.1 hypothetical protein D7V80_02335 [Corallococcus sp. CA054B]